MMVGHKLGEFAPTRSFKSHEKGKKNNEKITTLVVLSTFVFLQIN